MTGALFLLAFGGLFFWLGWRNRRKVLASMSWPYVLGRITATSVSKNYTQGDANTSDDISYTPAVQYEYQVETQVYKGDRLGFQTKGYGSHKRASAALESYPVGAPVQVYFDPGNPRNCVLERKAPGNSFLLVVGVVIMVLGVASFLASILHRGT
jgi:hypothetical protein